MTPSSTLREKAMVSSGSHTGSWSMTSLVVSGRGTAVGGDDVEVGSPSRSKRMTSSVPSGDHHGSVSMPGPSVSSRLSLPSMSATNRLVAPGGSSGRLHRNATRVASGAT